LGLLNQVCEGRLTLTSGTPVTTTDVTAATSVYFTPFNGNQVALYDGTRWRMYAFTELPLALGTLTSGKNYDVFLYDNAGTLTLESLAWTSDTARATALTTQDGAYVKSGATTRRYLGTFRTTSTTTTEDSGGGTTTQVGGKRFLWNLFNRVPRYMAVIDTTNTWTYTTASWRQANGASGNKVEYVCGLAEDPVTVLVLQSMNYATGSYSAEGVGVDSATARSGLAMVGYQAGTTAVDCALTATYQGIPGLGYHYLAWIENGMGSPAGANYSGDNGESGIRQSGLTATVRG
jgi:hypothetical protein